MAKYTLIGIKRVDLKNNSGELHGYSLYFTEPVRPDAQGRGSGSCFVIAPSKRSSLFLNDQEFDKIAPEVGEEYYFAFTRYGSIDKSTLELV